MRFALAAALIVLSSIPYALVATAADASVAPVARAFAAAAAPCDTPGAATMSVYSARYHQDARRAHRMADPVHRPERRFDEGFARLEDLSQPGSQYRVLERRVQVASMAATHTLFGVTALTAAQFNGATNLTEQLETTRARRPSASCGPTSRCRAGQDPRAGGSRSGVHDRLRHGRRTAVLELRGVAAGTLRDAGAGSGSRRRTRYVPRAAG